MKTKYYIFALAAMTMTLGSCSDSENTIGTEAPKSITVSTSIGKMTRINLFRFAFPASSQDKASPWHG